MMLPEIENLVRLQKVDDEIRALETRLRAIDSIAKDTKSFFCGTDLIEPGFVPVTLVGEQNELSRTEMEFDENWVRTQPSWPEVRVTTPDSTSSFAYPSIHARIVRPPDT